MKNESLGENTHLTIPLAPLPLPERVPVHRLVNIVKSCKMHDVFRLEPHLLRRVEVGDLDKLLNLFDDEIERISF